MFTMFTKPYNWKTSEDTINIFVQEFNKKLDITNFALQMVNLKEFIYFVELGRINGKEMTQKEIDKLNETLFRGLSSLEFNNQFSKEVDAFVKKDPGAPLAFYKANISNFTKEADGKQLIKSFREAEPEIIGLLQGRATDKLYGEWRNNMSLKYKVVFVERGLKTLISDVHQRVIKIKQSTKNK
jgi:hypothetical protein